jgi:hypothetical protein
MKRSSQPSLRLCLLLALAFAALPLAAQPQPNPDQRRAAEIQNRVRKGEQVSQEDRQFAQQVMRRMREEFKQKNPPRKSTGLVPLPDMGAAAYKGQQGGLYPGGARTAPPAHQAAGRDIARRVVPLDAEGRPTPGGRVVLLSVGMSNTTQEFQVFQELASADGALNPRLTIVDGAQGGQTASVTANPEAKFWSIVLERLTKAGVTPLQVQIAWIKQANAMPAGSFDDAAQKLQADIEGTVRTLKQKCPNARIAFLSSRTYGGYAETPLNPEPYAYEGAFAVREVIAGQIQGKPELNYDPEIGQVRAPWLAWGPYLWTDGLKGRKQDALLWKREDVVEDGTHPSDSGRRKVAALLMDFLKTDPSARPWFLANP